MHFDLRDGTDKSLAIRSGDLDVAYVSKDAAEDLQRAGAAVIEGLKDSAWYFLSFNNRKRANPLTTSACGRLWPTASISRVS